MPLEYLNNTQFNRKLDRFTQNAKKIDETAHQLLCSAAMLADPNQDGDENVDRLRRVLLAFPRGSRVKAAAYWCRTMFPVSVKDTSEDISVSMLKDKARAKHAGWQHERAAETPFWEFSTERDPAPIDPIAMVSATASRIRKAIAGKGKRPLKEGFDPDNAERIAAGLDALVEDTLTA